MFSPVKQIVPIVEKEQAENDFDSDRNDGGTGGCPSSQNNSIVVDPISTAKMVPELGRKTIGGFMTGTGVL